MAAGADGTSFLIMKTIGSFLIVGVLLVTQSLEAGERGGGVGFGVPAPRAPSSASHVTSAPIVQPAVVPHPASTFRPSYSPTVQAPQTLPSARTYVSRSTTIGSQQSDTARSTTTQSVQSGNARASNLQAVRRDPHQAHDRTWWRQHYPRIVLFGGGYYYWDAGYWYPCWGYDPNYSYDDDGPIYAYGNLLPDQVISNVQVELQQQGYYAGPINGSLDAATRAAIANYQRDRGLVVTATVDQPTVQSLGLA
jgi:hypothetical protein